MLGALAMNPLPRKPQRTTLAIISQQTVKIWELPLTLP